ncbi:MAG: hypothetical protein LIO70_01265 [Clostridiales bacterium]|nr:hypothetical protein [Clostridiales bacterium]
MSKPRNKWWGYVRRVLYEYPRMRSELDALQAPLQASGVSGGGHASGTGRPAEALALRTLPDRQEQRELEAVEAAELAQAALKLSRAIVCRTPTHNMRAPDMISTIDFLITAPTAGQG